MKTRFAHLSAALLLAGVAGTALAQSAPALHKASGRTAQRQVTGLAVWTGAIDFDYNNPGNWSGGAVPTAADDVIIPPGAGTSIPGPVLRTNAAVGTLLIDGGEMTIDAGAQLSISGSINLQGLLHAEQGTVVLNGTSQQNLTGGEALVVRDLVVGSAGLVLDGNDLYVNHVLTLNGDLDVNGRTLELESSATGTAMVVNNGAATVQGAVSVERYFDASRNPGLGYRHISSPVTGAQVQELTVGSVAPVVNPAYNTAPNPGAVLPFPNLFRFDQARVAPAASAAASFERGWFSPASDLEVLNPGEGYTYNVSPGLATVLTGTLNNGPITRSNLGRTAQQEAGWHLVGNPYPAPIDWNNVSRSGLDNAIYVFKSTGQYTGFYSGFVNGVSFNGGSSIVPMGQGFFVRTSAVGGNGAVSFTNAARLTSYQNPALERSTAETRTLVRMALCGVGVADEAVLYFESGATNAFDSAFDAYKVTLGTEASLSLPVVGRERLAVSALAPLNGATVTAPVWARVPAADRYTLSFRDVLNVPAGYFVYLRDQATGAVVDLAQQPSYSFLATPADSPTRLELLFTRQTLASRNPSLDGQVALYPNPAHSQVTLALPAALAGPGTKAEVYNALGQQVLSQTLGGGTTAQLPTEGLKAGVYTVRLFTAQGLVTKRLVIE